MSTPTNSDAGKPVTTKARRRRAAMAAPAIVVGDKFELTASEWRIAEQFFRATRRMKPHDKQETEQTVVRLAESLARERLRSERPALGLVTGGAA